MDVLLCPHCGAELEIKWSGEPEFPSDCYVRNLAECPNCERCFQFYEVFTFVGYEDLEEV